MISIIKPKILGLWFLLLMAAWLIDEIAFSPPPNKDRVEPIETSIPATNVTVPDLRTLADQMGNGMSMPTPEQLAEEKQIEQEQVNEASRWIESPDPQQRIAGAEQLAAYPTPEAEQLLVNALISDIDPEVRATAIRSLEAFKHPNKETIDALFMAVEDENEEVQLTALEALENIVTQESGRSKKSKALIGRLKQTSKSSRLKSQTKRAIRELIKELANSD